MMYDCVYETLRFKPAKWCDFFVELHTIPQFLGIHWIAFMFIPLFEWMQSDAHQRRIQENKMERIEQWRSLVCHSGIHIIKIEKRSGTKNKKRKKGKKKKNMNVLRVEGARIRILPHFFFWSSSSSLLFVRWHDKNCRSLNRARSILQQQLLRQQKTAMRL